MGGPKHNWVRSHVVDKIKDTVTTSIHPGNRDAQCRGKVVETACTEAQREQILSARWHRIATEHAMAQPELSPGESGKTG